MPFEAGHKKSNGRPKGALNRRTLAPIEKAKELGIDPLEVLLLFAGNKWKELGYEAEFDLVHGKDFTNQVRVIDPGTRMRAAGILCEYMYSKSKTVQSTSTITHTGEIDMKPKVIITLPSNGREAPPEK